MKYLITITAFLFIISCSPKLHKFEKTEGKTRVFIADVQAGENAPPASLGKIYAAMDVVERLTDKYEIVPYTAVDSVAKILAKTGKPADAQNIADVLNADRILFFNVNAIENMLRVEIKRRDFPAMDTVLTGKGYAHLNLVTADSGKKMYDPAILNAVQKAFAAAERDSSMFSILQPPFDVRPTKSLVVSSMLYVDNPDLDKWELFEEKTVSSYEAVETIFEEALISDDYTVYDIPTRDSIYAKFQFHMVENYTAPSEFELRALYNFDVDNIIAGSITRIREGAKVEMILFKFSGRAIERTRTVSDTLKSDDNKEYRKTLRKLTREVLEIEQN